MTISKEEKTLIKRDARQAAEAFLHDVKAITHEVKAYLDLVDNGDVDIEDPATGIHARALVDRLRKEVSSFPMIRDAFEAFVQEAKGYRDYFSDVAQKREKAFERFKMTEARQVVAEALEQLPPKEKSAKGEFGSVWIKHSESVVFSWGEDGKVTERQIRDFGIDQKYIKTTIVQTIDKDKVKADLQALVEIPWASIKEKKTPTGKLSIQHKARLERGNYE